RVSGPGGRGNTNVWTVRDPRELGEARTGRAPRRVAPPTGARPLVVSAGSRDAAVRAPQPALAAGNKGGQGRALTAENCPNVTGVSAEKGGHVRTVSLDKCPVLTGVSRPKGGQGQTRL